ncbi:MAG: glycosyl hydrolase family 8 [Halarcobacter sp.]
MNQGDSKQLEVIKPTYEQAELDTQLIGFYQQWKATYLRQGCGEGRYYVDVAGDGKAVEGGTADSTLSISEGHGYGMLITVMMAGFDPDAQEIFNGMVYFFHDHPAKSNPGLMAWNQLRTCENAGEDVGGDNSATDGDLDIAYALLLADSKWGSTGDINYKDEADKVISAIKQLEIDPINQFVRIGDWVDRVDDGQYSQTTRSSDFMVSHFKAFADSSEDNSWYLVRDQTYLIINHIRDSFSQNTSLIPDFIVDVSDNPRPAEANFIEGESDGEYSWNAVRYPWRIALDYILYNEQRAYDALVPINDWIKKASGGDPKNIADTYTLDGKHSEESGFDSMAFVSMFAVAATIDKSNQEWLDDLWLDINQKSINEEDYYGNTLKLLSMITITGHWQKP